MKIIDSSAIRRKRRGEEIEKWEDEIDRQYHLQGDENKRCKLGWQGALKTEQ